MCLVCSIVESFTLVWGGRGGSAGAVCEQTTNFLFAVVSPVTPLLCPPPKCRGLALSLGRVVDGMVVVMVVVVTLVVMI